MVRDEADIIEPVLRHLLAEGVDRLIVADNLSTDDTPAILLKLKNEGAPITVVEDDEPGYYQARKMTRLGRRAYDIGADWVLPFDADEVWYSPTYGSIGEALADMPGDVSVIRAPGWDHIVRADAVEVTDFGDRERSYLVQPFPGDAPFSPWRRAHTQKMVKVAFRSHPHARLHMGNHDVERPGRDRVGPLAFRHFQYRSLEQMTRKLRNGREAYEASDIHPMHGAHWRAGGLKTDAELAQDWADLCSEEGLVFDPAPLRTEVDA